MGTFFLLGFAAVVVLLLARLTLARFVLVVFDFAGFTNDWAVNFRFGAVRAFLVAFFAASLICFAAFLSAFLAFFSTRFACFAAFLSAFLAFFSARFACFAAFFSALLAFFSARFASFKAFFSAFLAFFSAISFAFIFFTISIPIESLENAPYNRSAHEIVR